MNGDHEVSRLGKMKGTFFSGLSKAATTLAQSVTLSSSSAKIEKLDYSQLEILNGLGMGTNGVKCAERDAIYDKFSVLCIGELFLSLERFVIDMIQRGHSPKWSDAAFRAFDINTRGSLSQYEYLLAVIGLQVDEENATNATWLDLRRQIVYSYYCRSEGNDVLKKEEFFEFLTESSAAIAEEPFTYGITNKKWCENVAENSINTAVTDSEAVTQALAISRVEYAQKQSDFEQLQLEYLKLEKKYCALKLDNASLKARLDIR